MPERSPIDLLIQQINQIQQLMREVAVGEKRLDDVSAEYIRLYNDVDERLEELKQFGFNIDNPNEFTAVSMWFRYWKSNLPSYADRRAYVDEMYGNLRRTVQQQWRQRNSTGKFENLKSTPNQTPRSLVVPIPSAIHDSLDEFLRDHHEQRTAFVIMRFTRTKAHDEITKTIRSVLVKNHIVGLRADDKEYNSDVYYNILTYIYGCNFGIAVFDRIESDEFNPNVSLEVGYMYALGKEVCLLKDRTLKGMQADLSGKLYRIFDPQDIFLTIHDELTKWLIDKSLIDLS